MRADYETGLYFENFPYPQHRRLHVPPAEITRMSSIKETSSATLFPFGFFVLIGSLRDFGLEIKIVFILVACFLIVEGKPESIVSGTR
jgi:hypothetical protein